MTKKNWQPQTNLTHLKTTVGTEPVFVNPPVIRGSTVLYPSVEELEASIFADPLFRTKQSYGRFGNANSRLLESTLCELEGGAGAVCTGSGLAAISTAIWAFVQSGDHILVSDSVYLPTRSFCNSLVRFGVAVDYFDPKIGADIQNSIRKNTKLVFLESPGSMTFEIQDIPAITKVCREKNITTLIDNTWATPLFLKPLALGVDVSIHSATKYISGHSDSFLGIILCNEAAYAPVRRSGILWGQCAAPDDVYAALRGLRTLHLRLKQHETQALDLAQWLQGRPEVQKVLHPGLPGFAGHEIWKRDFTGSSGLFSVLLDPKFSKPAVHQMLNSLNLFGLGHSWGGFESLAVPFDPKFFRAHGWEETGMLVRLHVGLESLDDLKADLLQGFRRLNAPV